MAKKDFINSDERLNTMLSNPLEIRKYMSILGAHFINEKTFVLDRKVLKISDENQLYIKKGATPSLERLFKKYGIPIYDNNIEYLESLILMHTAFNGENIEKCYLSNLNKVKKEMLLQVFNDREKIDFNGQFAIIDKVVAPFLSDNFDIDRFVDECVFSTTGYYSEKGYDKCLKFGWNTKKDPDTYYYIVILKNEYISTIMFRDIYDRFYQQIYHTVTEDNEKISHCIGGNYKYTIDYKSGETCEDIYHEEVTKKTTEQDIEKMKVILESMIDNSIAFEKETPKINVKK